MADLTEINLWENTTVIWLTGNFTFTKNNELKLNCTLEVFQLLSIKACSHFGWHFCNMFLPQLTWNLLGALIIILHYYGFAQLISIIKTLTQEPKLENIQNNMRENVINDSRLCNSPLTSLWNNVEMCLLWSRKLSINKYKWRKKKHWEARRSYIKMLTSC